MNGESDKQIKKTIEEFQYKSHFVTTLSTTDFPAYDHIVKIS